MLFSNEINQKRQHKIRHVFDASFGQKSKLILLNSEICIHIYLVLISLT